VRKVHDLLQGGQADKAKRHLPPERVYPVRPEIGRRLLIRCYRFRPRVRREDRPDGRPESSVDSSWRGQVSAGRCRGAETVIQ
jgi:hypothetical protein